MPSIFIPRKWRWPKVILGLLILEFPFTVANLALFGIASPNLYRTLLWKEGGKHGFNSDPSTILYAAANYRPVKTPLVWSNFNTQYNLVIGVLCMFFYLVKSTGWIINALWPVFSLPLHLGLAALWAYSLYVQTAPDTIDPTRENHGAPWYITKNCDVSSTNRIKGYCQQAKSAFIVSVVMLTIYAAFIVLSIHSLFPTQEARQRHAARAAEKKAEKEKFAAEAYENEMTSEQQWQHMWELQQLPRTPGTTGGIRSPVTPRTLAFQDLGGGGGYRGNAGFGGALAKAHQHQHQEYYGGGQQEVPVEYGHGGEDEFLDEGKAKGTAL